MNENELSKMIVDSAFKVHNALGPGLLESVYKVALAFELQKRGLKIAVERPIPAVTKTFISKSGFGPILSLRTK